MAEQRGTLETVASVLAKLFLPLRQEVAPDRIRFLLAELGLEFPASIATNATLSNAAKAAVEQIKDLPALLAELADAVEDEDLGRIISKGIELASAIAKTISELDKVATALKAAGAGSGIPAAELNQFAAELPHRLLDYLIIRNLEAMAGVPELLEFIGAIERTTLPEVDPQHPEFTRRTLHVDELVSFIGDPAKHLKTKYQWGAPGNAFTGVALLEKLHGLFTRAGLPAVLDQSGPQPVLDLIVVELRPKTNVDPRGLEITIAQQLQIDQGAAFARDDWQVRLVADTAVAAGLKITVQPNDKVTFVPPAGEAKGNLVVEWIGGKPDGTPYLILGQSGASRLEARQLVARAGVGLGWNAAAKNAVGKWEVGAEVKGGKVIVDIGEGDGFLSTIMAGFGLESDFNLGIGFSSKEGLFFHGSATLEIQLPIHVSLGPVDISGLTLSVGIKDNSFPIGISTDIKAALGPLTALVEGIGFEVAIKLADDNKGNIGPIDLEPGFKPPKGVGLALDAGVVKGGGYLYFDFDKEEYAGALELDIAGIVTVKAIGLITTRLPDGKKGFSLLIILSVEFGSGIQLGFGFTLLAVGGLVGLNRTMLLQPLMEAIRSGAISSIMFPKDVIANAQKIISDLRAIFPPKEGTFLIGPMAKLGWGTPTLASLSLGVIIEIPPGNVAILGILRVVLPTEEAGLIVLQVNFAGAIEVDKKRMYFFASLFDSHVLSITLEGDLGMLFAYGDDANFVVTVGGFHPRFSPPPLPFPSPKRLAFDILNTPVQRIRVEGYFAVTSNTAQFGARVELFFGFDVLNVNGHIAFDALIQFSPFYFIIQASAALSVEVFGAGLFSLTIALSLEGPTPYHAHGVGTISILFFDVTVEIDETWGEQRNTTLPPIAVMPLFVKEFSKPENWRALPPPTGNLLVSLRTLPSQEAVQVLHPVGVLRITQKALPLELKLERVGSQKPSDVRRLSVAVGAGGLGKAGDVLELFAPAQFQNMDDAQKLSRPAYGPERGGLDLSVAGQQFAASRMVKRIVRYEQIIIDTNFRRVARLFFGFTAQLFTFFLGGASVTQCELSRARSKQLQPFDDRITVPGTLYTVAFQATNKAFSADAQAFASEASARDFMARQAANDPGLGETLHVIPRHEMAA